MEKIWGVYNTFKDENVIQELSELDIWIAIENLGGNIFWLKHNDGKPWYKRVTIDELNEIQYNLEYLVYSTRRFGVEFDQEPSVDNHVQNSESYFTWYLFWKNHFDSMTREQYNEFINVKNKDGDISQYMPEGNWKDTLNKGKCR